MTRRIPPQRSQDQRRLIRRGINRGIRKAKAAELPVRTAGNRRLADVALNLTLEALAQAEEHEVNLTPDRIVILSEYIFLNLSAGMPANRVQSLIFEICRAASP